MDDAPHPTADVADSEEERLCDLASELEDVGMSDTGEDPPEPRTLPVEDMDHLTMEVTVDVSDLDSIDRRVLRGLADCYEDAFQEVVNKNRDYSYSFLTTGRKLAESDGTPFDSALRSQVFGLVSRIGDKNERLIENVFGDGSAEVSDSPAITAREAANYYLFITFILENPDLAVDVTDS